MSNIAVYTQLNNANYLDDLFKSYEYRKAAIEKFSDFACSSDVLEYFIFDAGNYVRQLAKSVFDKEKAIKALDADYWGQIINKVEILQSMPAKKRNELQDQIRKHQTLSFDKNTVMLTIENLLMQRGSFLAEKVEAIFYNLSGKHVTNSPMAFGQRMIIDYVIEKWRYTESYHACYSRCEYIDDLRNVIAQVLGRELHKDVRTASDVKFITDEKGFGDWYTFDGGAFNIRVYKKGTAHIEVHPEVAIKLNEVLSSKHPNVVASSKRGGSVYKQAKKTELAKDILSAEALEQMTKICDWLSRYSTYSASSMHNCSSSVIAEVEKVLSHLGGRNQGGNWVFPCDVSDAVKKVIMTGCIPDKKSHQFYPTKRGLAEDVISLADIEEGHSVLEPSAGHGGIADYVASKDLTCVEINDVNCEVLKSKGHKVICDDFLFMGEDDLKKFDRIVMNPPFNNGECIRHVKHAMRFMKKGGILVTVLPCTYKESIQVFDGCTVEWSDVYEDQFDNTDIRVVLLKLERC